MFQTTNQKFYLGPGASGPIALITASLAAISTSFRELPVPDFNHTAPLAAPRWWIRVPGPERGTQIGDPNCLRIGDPNCLCLKIGDPNCS